MGLYRADPDHIRIVPPGVDHTIFTRATAAQARERLHLTGLRLALFVGRLQPHKGPDVAVRTLAEAVARDPGRDARHASSRSSGGPSGAGHGEEVVRLMELASALGVAERVMLFPPQPQARLADFYAAADVVLVPSRSESFGLVALEAQACGTPVVAAAVGGLRCRGRGRRRRASSSRATTPRDHADAAAARPARPGGCSAHGRATAARAGAAVHVGRDGGRGRSACTAN